MATEVLIENVEYVVVPTKTGCRVGPVSCSLYPWQRCIRRLKASVGYGCQHKIFILKSEYPAVELQLITHRLKS